MPAPDPADVVISAADGETAKPVKSGMETGLSVRQMVYALILAGSIGTAGGGIGSTVFGPDQALRDAVHSNTEAIKVLTGVVHDHAKTGGHAAMEKRMGKVEVRLGDQEKAVKAFYVGPWAELMMRLGRIEAKIEARR